jgi:hypothetical protein
VHFDIKHCFENESCPTGKTKQNDQNRGKRSFAIPVIGLERPCEKERLKRHYETLKLRNHPEKGDASSQFSFVLDYYSTMMRLS